MAATFISALVIKHNNNVFISDTGVVGQTMSIPTPGAAGGVDIADYWAVPITDYGIFTGFNFEPATADDTTPPTIDSFHVFRLIGRLGNDWYYIRGKTTSTTVSDYGYIQAAADAECCESPARSLPTSIPVINGCQLMCEWDSNGLYFALWGLPSLSGNLRYLAYGYFNNVALAALGVSTGYTSGATLATAMNTAWSATVGGTFAFANNVMKLTQTAGPGTDVICVTIGTVNPSA